MYNADRLEDLHRESFNLGASGESQVTESTYLLRESRQEDAGFDTQFVELRSYTMGKLEELKKAVASLDGFASKIDNATLTMDVQEYSKEYEASLEKCSKLMKVVKSSLEGLRASANELKQNESNNKPAEVAFRDATFQTCTRELQKVMVNLESSRRVYAHSLKKKMKFQPEIPSSLEATSTSDGDYGAAEEGLGISGSTSVASGELLDFDMGAFDFSDQEDLNRLAHLERIERQMAEIREYFTEIATAIENQGEVVDNVEFNAVNAKNYTHLAQKQLVNARKKQQRRAKWCCCLASTAAVATVILVLVILSYAKTLFK